MDSEKIKSLIEAGLPGAVVIVSGDGRHFDAQVTTSAFVGKSMLQQHRMVYAALGGSFDTAALHALSLHTSVPE
tara:strand:- start:268 stop:489 length:222 start_codon:yes stop_codon:yes gene_type:complete